MRKLALAGVAMAALSATARPRAVCGTVRADATDPKALIEQINTAFTEYKATNDAALQGKADDTLVKGKLATLEADITKVTGALEKAQADLAAAKLGGSGGDAISAEAKEHAQAFDVFFRKGREPASGLRELEIKAGLTTQSDPDGGYLVPLEMEGTIDRVLGTVSAVRGLSRVINVSAGEYKKLVNMGGAGSGWVGEEEARPATGTPTLREISIQAMELYANPAATQTALDDAAFDVEAWLADEVSIAFAESEGTAFVNGSGVKKPRGILQYDTIANASYAWGSLGFVVSGAAAAALPQPTPADAIVDLYYALKAGLPQRGELPHLRCGHGHDPQVQGRPGQLPVGAAHRARHAGDDPGQAGRHRRQHAGARRERLPGGVRQLPARLPDRRPPGRARPARPLHLQAERAVLHD
jgi:HK97 family phage major capsid protein